MKMCPSSIVCRGPLRRRKGRLGSWLLAALAAGIVSVPAAAQQAASAGSGEAALVNRPLDAELSTVGGASPGSTAGAETMSAQTAALGNDTANPDVGAASPAVVVPKTVSLAAMPEAAPVDIDVASASQKALVRRAAAAASTAGAAASTAAATATSGSTLAAAEVDGAAE